MKFDLHKQTKTIQQKYKNEDSVSMKQQYSPEFMYHNKVASPLRFHPRIPKWK